MTEYSSDHEPAKTHVPGLRRDGDPVNASVKIIDRGKSFKWSEWSAIRDEHCGVQVLQCYYVLTWCSTGNFHPNKK